ncbi:hypothetical protein PC116_g3641 [Phytophthora cactorum]|nr:hypothetical protein PC123_g6206 [Phytophthora cactorum]KAG4248670.1 hypothetical protein PC116_g3641 [Phytophthora cactorum]
MHATEALQKVAFHVKIDIVATPGDRAVKGNKHSVWGNQSLVLQCVLALVPVIALPLVACWASYGTYGAVYKTYASFDRTASCGYSTCVSSTSRSAQNAALECKQPSVLSEHEIHHKAKNETKCGGRSAEHDGEIAVPTGKC